MVQEGVPVRRIALPALFVLTGILPIAANGAPTSSPAVVHAEGTNTNNKPQIETFGDWDVRCFPIKSPSPCDAFFAMVRKQTGQRILSVSIAFSPSQKRYLAQFAVPFGVSLADGLVIATDSFTSARMQYRRCDRGGCYVEIVMAPELIDALKAAANATLKVASVGGQAVSFKLSLKGFGQAHDAMVDHAKKKAQPS
jgi:invasion protein IalB